MKLTNLATFFSLAFVFISSTGFVKNNNKNTFPKLNTPTKVVTHSFAEFLSLFEKTELPYSVNLDDLEEFEKTKLLAKPSKKSRKTNIGNEPQILRQFLQKELYISRMGPPAIVPVARFYPNEKTVAVIYASYQRAFSNGSSYTLALFDLEGNWLQKQKNSKLLMPTTFHLGQISPYGGTKTFSIDANKQIVQKTYKANWKNDVKEVGIKNNEITDYVLEKTEQFEIRKDGVVAAKVDEGSTDRASVN